MSKQKRSKAEQAFIQYWTQQQFQELFPFVEEYRYHPVRRWRLDFANLEYKLGIEVQGSGWGHGGSAKSLASDIEKQQQLALLGWTLIPVAASAVTKNVEIALDPIVQWVNLYTSVKLNRGW